MTITFICTGNICRSQAAQAILRRMLKDYGITDVAVSSFGTADVGRQPCDGVMARVSMKYVYTRSFRHIERGCRFIADRLRLAYGG